MTDHVRPSPSAAIRLRRPLTPAEARVFALMDEAPGYKRVGATLGLAPVTVRNLVCDIAALLPADFVPEGSPKERVIIYAVRCWALGETPPVAAARRAAA